MIAITADNEEIISQICCKQELFATEKDFGCFAFAYTLMHKMDLELDRELPGKKTTKWSLETLDKDGELRAISKALHPELEDSENEKFIEYAINKGIEEIGNRMIMGQLHSISELLELDV